MIPPLTPFARGAIRAQIGTLLGDGAFEIGRHGRGEGLFGRDAVSRRVHAPLVPMLAGGVAALLIQMLHPAALAGVWDHSRFRDDMIGRLRRTARFVAVTTYGTHDEAEWAIAAVRAVHRSVQGRSADGTPYAADDPDLLDWVHLGGTSSFLAAWRRYGDRHMSGADQDRYYAEMAEIARALGASRPPRDRREAERLLIDYRPHLRADGRTREVAAIVLGAPHAARPAMPLSGLVTRAGLDLVPGWARALHGRSLSLPESFAVRSATLVLARAVEQARG